MKKKKGRRRTLRAAWEALWELDSSSPGNLIDLRTLSLPAISHYLKGDSGSRYRRKVTKIAIAIFLEARKGLFY